MDDETLTTLEEKLDTLSQQISELGEQVGSQNDPQRKFCLRVEELARRWDVCPEAIRRLVREKQLKPLRGFRPFRFTFDEIRRYEAKRWSKGRRS